MVVRYGVNKSYSPVIRILVVVAYMWHAKHVTTSIHRTSRRSVRQRSSTTERTSLRARLLTSHTGSAGYSSTRTETDSFAFVFASNVVSYLQPDSVCYYIMSSRRTIANDDENFGAYTLKTEHYVFSFSAPVTEWSCVARSWN